ncbi:MAG: hypothetical protein LBF19_04815 [Prevotellaceae bacterium]|jgi:hypothetical protein|nr:hypothetical protein [Prevotellaceae bacterium]
MESIVPVLIGLAVLILQAVASSNKKKEEARRRAVAPSRPQSYAPPQERPSDPFEELLKSLTSPPPMQEEVETVEATDVENYEEEDSQNLEQALYPQDRRPSVEMQMAVPTIQPVPDQLSQNEPATDPATTETAWYDDAFDLKKAVIYSEILQRKHFN